MKHRLALILPLYVGLFALSLYVGFLLRFDFQLSSEALARYWTALPFALIVKCAVAGLSGEWRRTFRYATLTDMGWVVAGGTLAALGLYLCNLALLVEQTIPRSVIVIDWAFCIVALCGLRSSCRYFLETVQPWLAGPARDRAVIFGADQAALAMYRAVQAERSPFQVVGFVCDGPERRGSLLAGLPVFNNVRTWTKLVRKHAIKHVLISSSIAGKEVRRLLDQCQAASLKAHVIPGVNEIVAGRFKLGVRDVTISDLLRRAPTELDMAGIASYVAGRRVLVTGGAGSIGSELCRQILSFQPAALVLLDQSEFGVFTMEQELLEWRKLNPDNPAELQFVVCDVTHRERLQSVFETHRPELVFHAAAYKHVPLMEDNPQEAIRNNVFGTKNVVDLADEMEVGRLVLISTDKAVRPTSVMGATKLLAEKYLQAKARESNTEMMTVRFGNVLNSAGSVVPTFRKQIEAGGPITVTHPDMVRFFMTIPEAVQLVLQAGAVGKTGHVLILEMGDPVKIFDLAKDMILLSGLRFPEDIDIVFSGIRPGEKLYEELFYETEEGAEKVCAKIFCAARTGELHMFEVQRDLQRLGNVLQTSNPETLAALWDVVQRHVAAESTPTGVRKAA